jgi:prophage DNA circulation protein
VLLAEPNGLLRQTVAITARSAGLADVQEVSTLGSAREQLLAREFDALILRLDDSREALRLIEAVRAGRAFTHRDVQVALIAEQCDQTLAGEVRALAVRHLMLQPLRARHVLSAMEAMLEARAR